MNTLRAVSCSYEHHHRLRSTPRLWARLVLVGYGEAAEEDAALEYRDCPCGSTLAIAFRPDFDQLAAVKAMRLSPVRLARLMFDGSREAGVLFCAVWS